MVALLQSRSGLADLKDKIQSASLHPVLCHLNADTSWLLSLAYPADTEPPPGRRRYNILIDPWFTGSQSDVASWFSTQYHAIESSVQDIATLNTTLEEAETALLSETSQIDDGPPYYIDAVVISHEFTDHCHKATLLELPPQTPVFSTSKAVTLIRSWNHFNHVIDVPSMNKSTDWHTTAVPPLPPWLGISRLITEGNSLYYHSAIIICIPANSSDNTSAAEAIIYTPHGVQSDTFSTLITASPPIRTLAFLHGLHDVSITLTKQLNLGAHNAFKAQKLLKPKYWVGTHDEVKRGLGLIGPLLRRKAWTLDDAVKRDRKEEGKRKGSNSSGGGSNGVNGGGSETTMQNQGEEEKVPFVQCGNGESIVLE